MAHRAPTMNSRTNKIRNCSVQVSEHDDQLRPDQTIEKRIAPDGKAYTYDEFVKYFRKAKGNKLWRAAEVEQLVGSIGNASEPGKSTLCASSQSTTPSLEDSSAAAIDSEEQAYDADVASDDGKPETLEKWNFRPSPRLRFSWADADDSDRSVSDEDADESKSALGLDLLYLGSNKSYGGSLSGNSTPRHDVGVAIVEDCGQVDAIGLAQASDGGLCAADLGAEDKPAIEATSANATSSSREIKVKTAAVERKDETWLLVLFLTTVMVLKTAVERKLETWTIYNPRANRFEVEKKQQFYEVLYTNVVLTTVMLRNIPGNLSRDFLQAILDENGFLGLYNFLYLPVDLRFGGDLGYAFVNFVRAADANRFVHFFEGYADWGHIVSDKVGDCGWSDNCLRDAQWHMQTYGYAHSEQYGYDVHVSRYRNSPVMHHSVPDKYKPIVLDDGVRVPFPPNTKRIRAPKPWW